MSTLPLGALLAASLPFVACGPSSSPSAGASAPSSGPLRVLILDGQNNHDWKGTTAATKATLLACGRFTVDVATSPADKEATAEWEAWLPRFADYDVVLSNYNDGGHCVWSEKMKTALLDFIRAGGGFVAVHAADNSSADWPEYNRLIGVGGWGGRTPADGSQMRRVDGKWTPVPAPDGDSGSHGAQHEFLVEAAVPDHPILAGLPAKWLHGKDELYDSLRGPCEELTVLASAYSPRTERHEPMLMTIGYGKGRVLHLPMGHVGGTEAVHCVGFQTVLARGTEWAATGRVTIPMPADFPSAEASSVVAPEKVRWKAAAGGDGR